MTIDIGKSAKRMGCEHPKYARKVDQEPIRVPPHKKPRTYVLEVRFETVVTQRLSKEFTTKAAMQEFRTRVQRELDKRKTAPPKRSQYWFSDWRDRYELKMDELEYRTFKAEPVFVESKLETT